MNLRKVLEWMSGFQGVEIIVVEQDRNTKIDHLNLPGKHIFMYNDGPFIKSLAYNVGLKHSTGQVVVFGDADVIMNPNELIESLNQTQFYDAAESQTNGSPSKISGLVSGVTEEELTFLKFSMPGESGSGGPPTG